MAILNVDGDHECFYLGRDDGFWTSLGSSPLGTNLWLVKNNFPAVRLNAANVYLVPFQVYVAPAGVNPYSSGTIYQPTVTITGMVQAKTTPTDIVNIPISTSITIPKYDF